MATQYMKDKPTAEDFAYAYAETADGALVRVPKSKVTGVGVTTAQANSLWAIMQKIAFTETLTDEELTGFKTAWGIESGGDSGETEVTLSSISVTYTGGDVTVGTALTDLTGLTVTGTYSDGSISEIAGYTLSGTIAEGNNTITVSYGGKMTTFTVTGVTEIVAVYGVDLTWDSTSYGNWSENGNWFMSHYNEETASVQVGNGFLANRVYSKPIDGTKYKYFRVPTAASDKQYAVSNNVFFYGCDSPNALTEEGHTVTECTKKFKFVACDFSDDYDAEGMTILYPAEKYDYYYVNYKTANSLTLEFPNLLGIFDANILENPLANPTE